MVKHEQTRKKGKITKREARTFCHTGRSESKHIAKKINKQMKR